MFNILLLDVLFDGMAEADRDDVAALRLFCGELESFGSEFWEVFGD